MSNLPVNHRPVKPSDMNFVYNAWLKSHRNSPSCKAMNNDLYYNHQKDVIESILEHSTIIVACNEADEDQIYGFCVYNNNDVIPTLHYIYNKYTYRKLGLATALIMDCIPTFGIEYTQCTHAGDKFNKIKDKYKLVYNPFKLKED